MEPDSQYMYLAVLGVLLARTTGFLQSSTSTYSQCEKSSSSALCQLPIWKSQSRYRNIFIYCTSKKPPRLPISPRDASTGRTLRRLRCSRARWSATSSTSHNAAHCISDLRVPPNCVVYQPLLHSPPQFLRALLVTRKRGHIHRQ